MMKRILTVFLICVSILCFSPKAEAGQVDFTFYQMYFMAKTLHNSNELGSSEGYRNAVTKCMSTSWPVNGIAIGGRGVSMKFCTEIVNLLMEMARKFDQISYDITADHEFCVLLCSIGAGKDLCREVTPLIEYGKGKVPTYYRVGQSLVHNFKIDLFINDLGQMTSRWRSAHHARCWKAMNGN